MTLPSMCPADLDYAVRAILPLPRDVWAEAAEHLVRATVLADKVRTARGRGHPALGMGTLSATVSRWPMQPVSEMAPADQAEVLAALSRAVLTVTGSNAPAEPRAGSGVGGEG